MSLFVAIEGIPYSGKSDLAANLATYYRANANVVAFPRTRSPFAHAIHSDLRATGVWDTRLDTVAFAMLCAADRRDGAVKEQDAAEGKDVLIFDSYMFTGMADSIARGVDSKLARQLEQNSPWPDLVIKMVCDPDHARRKLAYICCRRGLDEERPMISPHARRMDNAFDELLAAYPSIEVFYIHSTKSSAEKFIAARSAIDASLRRVRAGFQ